ASACRSTRRSGCLGLAVLVDLDGLDRPHADQHEDGRFLFALPRPVPVDRVRFIDGDRTSAYWVRGLLVVDVARGDPPGSGDHVRVALLIVKMRLGEVARVP